MKVALEIIQQHYPQIKDIKSIAPFGNGHINDTFLVDASAGKYILQKVNKRVFATAKLVGNYEILVPEVQKYQDKSGQKITPDIYKTKSGIHHCFDDGNAAWRLVEFIENAQSFDISPDSEISCKAAKAIGSYQLFLNTIDPERPCDTIKNFHNLPGRVKLFNDALRNADQYLLANAREEIILTKEFAFIEAEAAAIIQTLTPRVTHNDTKLNNIIFKDNNSFVIDLDTVMKGYVMFDFGDMVRTFTSPALEDEKDLSQTSFRIEHFEALTKGYLEHLKDELTIDEKESLLTGAFYIIYEQVLRFLADYLNGNIYYKVAYPEHNLVRTKTQLRLLGQILNEKEKLNMIVAAYS